MPRPGPPPPAANTAGAPPAPRSDGDASAGGTRAAGPQPWREAVAALPLPRWLSSPGRLVAALSATGAALVVGAVAVVALRGAQAPSPLTLPRAVAPAPGGAPAGAPEGGAEAAPGATYVHAAGAVARPGVYRLRAGARVADVLDAAGGPHPDADLDRLNLAAKVADGERVYVPRRGEASPPPAAAGGDGGSAPGTGPVDLNTATLEQLEALPGIGPATAQAILEHRRQHGRFRRVEDLLEVRGIGEAKLAALRSRVRV